MDGVEAIWVQVRVNQRKLLVGGIYRPPNAFNVQWLNVEHCLDLAFHSARDNILVTCDFNIHIEDPSNKMGRLITSYNTEQLITRSTHFTEHSS